MTNMTLVDIQYANEYTYNKRFIDNYIKQELLELYPDKVQEGVVLLQSWLAQEYYPVKQARVNKIKELNLTKLVEQIFIGCSYCQQSVLFTAVSAQLASRLEFSDKQDSIQTIAEITAVLSDTDIFDILKEKRVLDKGRIYYPLVIKSRVIFSDKLLKYIENSCYLPPMVSQPDEIKTNSNSGYYTFNESVILKDNHHDDPISLDVLNTQNRIKLQISARQYKYAVPIPKRELDTIDKLTNWDKFIKQSNEIIELVQSQTQGNPLYITNKFDKRGRLYASGYHINTMGSSYQKSLIELHKQENVDVPEQYQKAE